MAKQNAFEQVSTSSAGPHGFLHSLAESFHQIVIAISSRLSHMHLLRSQIGDAKGELDIWHKLGNHVKQIPVREKTETKQHPRRDPANTVTTEQAPTLVKGAELSELGRYNVRKAILEHHPHISDQLQRRTMEHINLSLGLAREGRKDAAKLHIDLAQSAMHTASRFMSHDEYDAFAQKVERRLESIVQEGRTGPQEGENPEQQRSVA